MGKAKEGTDKECPHCDEPLTGFHEYETKFDGTLFYAECNGCYILFVCTPGDLQWVKAAVIGGEHE